MLKNSEQLLESARKNVEACLALMGEKTKLYGVRTVGELGARGEFVQIHRKYTRLRQMIWEGKSDDALQKKHRETVVDTLFDMINYCLIMLAVLEAEK